MKKSLLSVLCLLLVASFLAGCGIPQEDYDQVSGDLAAAQAEIAALEIELDTVKQAYINLQTDHDAIIVEVDEWISRRDSARPYYDIAAGLLLPTITGDTLTEEGTILKVGQVVEQTGDEALQEAYDAWAKKPGDRSLASYLIELAMLKWEGLIYE